MWTSRHQSHPVGQDVLASGGDLAWQVVYQVVYLGVQHLESLPGHHQLLIEQPLVVLGTVVTVI